MRTSRIIAAALVLTALGFCSPSVEAQPRIGSFGFGISLFDPLAVSFKGDLGPRNAWTVAVGKSWFGALHIHAEYLWNANVFNSQKAGMYFGLGPIIGSGRGTGFFSQSVDGSWYYHESMGLGVRGVGGFNFMPFSAPVEIFAELAPVIGITPTTGFGFQIAIGAHYYP